MEGVELEDQGEDGVRLTHWEKRLMEVSCGLPSSPSPSLLSFLPFAPPSFPSFAPSSLPFLPSLSPSFFLYFPSSLPPLQNELMTATYTHEHVISRMTLAFMQDTG